MNTHRQLTALFVLTCLSSAANAATQAEFNSALDTDVAPLTYTIEADWRPAGPVDSHDGIDALSPAAFSPNAFETRTLNFPVNGTARVRFWMRETDPDNALSVEPMLDGDTFNTIAEVVATDGAWQQWEVLVPSGAHTAGLVARASGHGAGVEPVVNIDSVEILPGGVPVAPFVTFPPEAPFVSEGNPTDLFVGTMDDSWFTFQWWKNDIAIAGATAPNYGIIAFDAEIDVGDYRVEITHADGSASWTSEPIYVAPQVFGDGWFNQAVVVYDGPDGDGDGSAKQSGALPAWGLSSDLFFFEGRGELEFFWKVSSALGDTLTLSIGMEELMVIEGDLNWQKVTLEVGAVGAFTTGQFEYRKDGAVEAGLDAGFIDGFVFTPYNTAPEIFSLPIDGAITFGDNYTYFVNVQDPDDANDGSGALIWTLVEGPAGMTLSNTGLLEWTPANAPIAPQNITIRVADGGEDGSVPAEQTFQLEVVVQEVDLMISDTSHGYDGTPKPITVISDPAGIAYSVTYDGLPAAPSNAGSYPYNVLVTQPGYAGSTNGILEINPAPSVITLEDLEQNYSGQSARVTVVTDPVAAAAEVIVTYDGGQFPPTLPGSYAVLATLPEGNFIGDPVADTLVINKRHQSIIFPPMRNKPLDVGSFDTFVTATSGLPYTITSSDPAIVEVDGRSLIVHDVGSVTITATQAGDATWNPAKTQTRSFTIGDGDEQLRYAEQFRDVDLFTLGDGVIRGTQLSSVITIPPLAGNIRHAFLYWQGSSVSTRVNFLPFNAAGPQPTPAEYAAAWYAGQELGVAATICEPVGRAIAHRADITAALAAGAGDYLWNFDATVMGVSLIVLYDDGDSSNNRDVVLYHGNDSNVANSDFPIKQWNAYFHSVPYVAASGPVELTMHVSESEDEYGDALTYLNDVQIVGLNEWDNSSVDGVLWDVKARDITAQMANGDNSLHLQNTRAIDCFALLAATIELPAGTLSAAPDLFVSGSRPAVISPDGPTTTVITITNQGGQIAPLANVLIRLPACALVVAAESTHGVGFAENPLASYQLGDLAPDETATVTITWYPGAYGESFVRASATTRVPESGLAPNAFFAEYTVAGSFGTVEDAFTRITEDGALEILWPTNAGSWRLETSETLLPQSWRSVSARPTIEPIPGLRDYFVHRIEDAPLRFFVRWANKNFEEE